MGKKIDGFVLSVAAAAALYLYFYHAFENHAVSFVLAGICFVLLAKLIRRTIRMIGGSRWLKKRRICRNSGSTIMHLACEEPQQAAQSIADLLKKSYAAEYPLELVQLHPSSMISRETVFELWKKHKGEDKLVICATCGCDAACRMMCESLKQPKIALLDANAISQLIAEYPEHIYKEDAPVQKSKLRFKRLGALLFNRKNAPRSLLFSGVMMLMYLLSARISYLLSSLALLFIALAAFHHENRPVKLF